MIQNGSALLEDSLAASTKLNIFLPYDIAIAFLGIYSNEIKLYIHKKLAQKGL